MSDQEALRQELAELELEPRDLDDVIARLTERAPYSRLQLQRLKKRKLILKDQIAQVEAELYPDIILEFFCQQFVRCAPEPDSLRSPVLAASHSLTIRLNSRISAVCDQGCRAYNEGKAAVQYLPDWRHSILKIAMAAQKTPKKPSRQKPVQKTPVIGVIMGSRSNWPTMKHTVDILEALGVPHESKVISAHRTPDRMADYAKFAAERRLSVIVAGAGGAAHLPGMVASNDRPSGTGCACRKQGFEWHGQSSVHRPDAERHPGRHPRHRPLWRQECGTTRGLHRRAEGRGYPETTGKMAREADIGRAGKPARPSWDTDVTTPLSAALIGIFGGGQLGRMAAVAAAQLGYKCHIFSPDADAPAKEVSASATTAPYEDINAARAFAHAVDVVTFEFENVPDDTLAAISETVPVRPGVDALHVSQDRAIEKSFLNEHGIGTAPWAPVNSAEDLSSAAVLTGVPLDPQNCRFGYDGKGQVRVDSGGDIAAARGTISTRRRYWKVSSISNGRFP